MLDLYRIVGPEYFTAPYLPPAMFRRFVVPHVAEMTRLIHARGGKVRLHCHGKMVQVLDMILDRETARQSRHLLLERISKAENRAN